MKRFLLAGAALTSVLVVLPMFAAFEAHVVNVTATIENGLNVPLELTGMSFGNVFPEEVLHQNLDISLSGSFLSAERVDDVNYMVRQKPKCGVPVQQPSGTTTLIAYSSFPQVTEDGQGNFICPEGSVQLPLLCPYLSKHEITTDGNGENDIQASSTLPYVLNGINAFHGPLTGWTLADTIATQVTGHLVKADGDTADQWDIDLHAPCFKGQCAQDNVIPVAYQSDPNNEHQTFGCDLWVEVTGISLPGEEPEPATLIVIKHVVNDSGTGTQDASNFTMNVTAVNPSQSSFAGVESPGTSVTVDAGAYSVDESATPTGYTKSLSADCSGTIAAGETKTCTITNDDNPRVTEFGELTVTKIVSGGTNVVADFPLFVDGMSIISSVSTTTSAGAHIVTETGLPIYTASFSGDCDVNGNVNVPANGNASCTITNALDGGTLTVTKIVDNADGFGTKLVSDFPLFVDGNPLTSGVPASTTAGAHVVSETTDPSYTSVISGDCDVNGNVTVPADGTANCTITNTVNFFTATVNKVVTNDDGGDNVIGDFSLFLGATGMTSGVSKKFAPGTYLVSESGVGGYNALFSGDCSSSTQLLTGANGDVKTCTLTNDDITPVITLVKNVVGGGALPTDFVMRVDTVPVPTGGSKSVTSNGAGHVIDEDAKSGYTFTSMTGTGSQGSACPSTLGGSVTLKEGEVITCTITNTVNP